MNNNPEEAASNEAPEGTQYLYAQFAEDGKWFNCEYIPDIVYATYEGTALKLQIVKPAYVVDAKFPLIVFIQGSAWRKQNTYFQIPALSRMAEKGYVIASVEVRDTDLAPFPAQLEDVKCAIRFMRANAEKYCVDPAEICVWGDSSGGHLAMMTGLTMGKYSNSQNAGFGDGVAAVVDFYGVTDILTLGKYNKVLDHDAADAPEALLLGGKVAEHTDEAKRASPIYQDLDQNLPPFLIVHGDSDKIVHVSQSIEMYKALKRHGKKALFYKVVGADHGIGVWNPEVLRVTESFLSATLKQPDYEKLFFQHAD